jgi:amidohydrolase family protein
MAMVRPKILCGLCLLTAATIPVARSAAAGSAGVDLAVIHAAVLDVTTGTVLRDRTVLASDGVITAVTPSDRAVPKAAQVVDAHGRLLTPGLIDAHFHMCSISRPACTNPRDGTLQVDLTPNGIAGFRRYFASFYLPYGVTAVRDVGSEERLLPMLLAWMHRSPDAPDYYPVGADLISPDRNHVPAPWQVEVADSAAAAAKVREYYRRGIRNIKLYWRLREPAFQGGLVTAQSLGMNVTAHVDFNVVAIDRAIALGLRHVEHMTAWLPFALGQTEIDRIYQDVGRRLRSSDGQYPGFFYLAVPEEWNAIGSGNARLATLVRTLASTGTSVTPTLHVFAQPLGLAWFTLPPRDLNEDASHFAKWDRARAIAGYRIMASYVRQLYDAGVQLNVGTDAPQPGKAVLSEMLLLHDAGIPMIGVFRIATLESAIGIGHGAEYGAIEPGRRADMILFDGDPLARPHDILGRKSVIKDGALVPSGNHPP